MFSHVLDLFYLAHQLVDTYPQNVVSLESSINFKIITKWMKCCGCSLSSVQRMNYIQYVGTIRCIITHQMYRYPFLLCWVRRKYVLLINQL